MVQFLNGILNPKCSKSGHNGGHFESHELVLFWIGRDHLDFVNLLERTIPKLNHSKSELQNVPILNGFSIRGPTVLIIFCYYILVQSIFLQFGALDSLLRPSAKFNKSGF